MMFISVEQAKQLAAYNKEHPTYFKTPLYCTLTHSKWAVWIELMRQKYPNGDWSKLE